MKESKYNLWLNMPDGTKVGYNCETCSFAKFDDETVALYEYILKNNINLDSLDEINRESVSMMKQGMFIVPNNHDNLQAGRFRYLTNTFSKEHLTMTILPTLDCNLRCTYCFEEHKKICLDKSTIEAIKKYANEYIIRYRPKSFFVSWYGGEPLLEYDKVVSLSEYFISLAEENNILYTADMISNCVLLTKEKARKLKDLRIDHIQVTIDGDRVNHNKKRKYINGAETFDLIINNIIEASELMNFHVRLNVDKTTYSNVEQMLEDIKCLSNNKAFAIYAAPLRADVTTACASVSETCFNLEEYAKINVNIIKLLYEKGFGFSWNPTIPSGGCGATNPSSCVIQPNGELCRCWTQVGQSEESYGNINNLPDTFRPENYYKWVLFDPYADSKCHDCPIFPSCLLGCPAKTVPPSTEYTKPSFDKDNRCTVFKYNYSELLTYVYRLHSESKEGKNEKDN